MLVGILKHFKSYLWTRLERYRTCIFGFWLQIRATRIVDNKYWGRWLAMMKFRLLGKQNIMGKIYNNKSYLVHNFTTTPSLLITDLEHTIVTIARDFFTQASAWKTIFLHSSSNWEVNGESSTCWVGRQMWRPTGSSLTPLNQMHDPLVWVIELALIP